MNGLVPALKTVLIRVLLWSIVSASIVYLVQYGLILITLTIKLVISIFVSVGETLKNYIWLLVAWMFIFCTVKNPPFSKIIYKSMTSIAIPPKQECSICLNDCCDVLIEECQHHYHLACLDNWIKKSQTCPNCRIAFKPHKNRLSLAFIKNFITNHWKSALFIGGAWLLITLKW